MSSAPFPGLAGAALLSLATAVEPPVQTQRPAPLQAEALERSLAGGLRWLREHQTSEGFWTVDGDSGAGSIPATSLALLALLGAADPGEEGPAGEPARRAAGWLAKRPPINLDVRSQGLVLHALAEARRRDPEAAELGDLRQRVAALLAARNVQKAWSAAEGDLSDEVVTSWCTLGLLSARAAGVDLALDELTVLEAWFEERVDDTGHVPVETNSGAPAHGAAVCLPPRVLLAPLVSRAPRLEAQARRLLRPEARPDWEQEDLEGWCAGTLGLELLRNPGADGWHEEAVRMLFANQLAGGSAAGSWPAVGFAPERGAVRTTAMALLVLEAPRRASRLLEASVSRMTEVGDGEGEEGSER